MIGARIKAASLLGAMLGAMGLWGCDAQQSPSYNGEPLATLQGEISSARSSIPEAEVALVWSVTTGSPDTIVVESAPVTGSFPAAFKLDILAPPPPEALMESESGDGKYGLAYIAVFEKGKPYDLEKTLLGGAPSHVVLYLANDFPQATAASKWIGNARTKGFHLMRATPPDPSLEGTEDYSGMDVLIQEPNGFDTLIPVQLPAGTGDEVSVFPNVE